MRKWMQRASPGRAAPANLAGRVRAAWGAVRGWIRYQARLMGWHDSPPAPGFNVGDWLGQRSRRSRLIRRRWRTLAWQPDRLSALGILVVLVTVAGAVGVAGPALIGGEADPSPPATPGPPATTETPSHSTMMGAPTPVPGPDDGSSTPSPTRTSHPETATAPGTPTPTRSTQTREQTPTTEQSGPGEETGETIDDTIDNATTPGFGTTNTPPVLRLGQMGPVVS